MKLRLSSFLHGGLLLLAVGMLARPGLGQGPPAAVVRVDEARLQTLQEHRLVTGELRAVRRARIASQEEGLLIEFAVEEGQIVARGDVLAMLDAQRIELELQQVSADEQVAQATVQEREAELEWRQRDVTNQRSAYERGGSNVKELRDAESAAKIAQARLAAANGQLVSINARAALLRKRLADTSIIAPFDGVIVSKLAETGEWLAAGGAIAEVISTGAIDVWLDVPQQYADAVLDRTPTITVRIDATGESIETSNLRAIPLVQPNARTFSLVARLENVRGVAPGMTVQAWTPTGDQAEQLTVHRDAVLRNPNGAFVYAVRDNGARGKIAALADVQVLFGARDRLVVRSGTLAPGDMVVIEGNERLFPMSPVNPIGQNE